MIQIDMQMPKNCFDCPACNEYLMCAIPCNGRGWGENDVKDFSQSRPEWCPMKEQEAVKQKTGHWFKIHGGTAAQCTICKRWGQINMKFCPWCGAKMET